jgi:SOS-response transcriptional repressor LexA
MKKQRDALTPRQAQILKFIKNGVLAGNAPSVREIGNEFGIRSPNGVMCHLKALAKKGYIARTANVAHGITLVGTPPMTVLRALRKQMTSLDPTGDITVTLSQSQQLAILELTSHAGS